MAAHALRIVIEFFETLARRGLVQPTRDRFIDALQAPGMGLLEVRDYTLMEEMLRNAKPNEVIAYMLELYRRLGAEWDDLGRPSTWEEWVRARYVARCISHPAFGQNEIEEALTEHELKAGADRAGAEELTELAEKVFRLSQVEGGIYTCDWCEQIIHLTNEIDDVDEGTTEDQYYNLVKCQRLWDMRHDNTKCCKNRAELYRCCEDGEEFKEVV